jgi:RNA polymerase sigma factor (sigma-70 family)
MSRQWKRTVCVDFSRIEYGQNLSGFETSLRELLRSSRDWDNFIFWMDLEEALKSLTEKQRLCFSLKYIGGFSESEVGELLGMSQPMVFKHIRAAAAKIKLFLSDGYKEP